MEVILGIDFGTSCTSAGALFGDRIDLIQDAGDVVIPTVVHVPARGPLEIGRRAVMRMLSEPSGVIRSVKRVLGVPASSPLVRQFAAGAPFRIDTSHDRIAFKLASGEYAPEQIAAAVLARVRELAEVRFGGQVRKAVITMSASPPERYREALLRAARIAHLDVLEMIAEPIAGALAVGMHGELAERRLVICDFGGGTFDVSAVVQSGLKFAPVATQGDPWLGGDDLDLALAEGLAGAVFKKCGYDMHRDTVRWNELLIRCEGIKRQLSTKRDVPFAMREAYVETGRSRDLEIVIDRAWAEARWQPLLERVQATILGLLQRAGWRADDVDRVALIGGGSLVPMFQRYVGAVFPEQQVIVAPMAEVAVARGAVLLSARHGAAARGVPVLDLAGGVA
ncbi:MAG TPA: Hsp70 family protein [Kofleriaceae bacterium]|nr:Hsp70 family protein [Kofleriaceae bacterium]